VEKLDGAGHSMRVEVQLGQRNESQIQILAGLKEGDKIILRVQQPQEQIIFNQS
jgi:multidrug efflux pump subunit AcrA (membrane-fusion protein)